MDSADICAQRGHHSDRIGTNSIFTPGPSASTSF